MGQMISYKRPDGKSVSGYLAEPKAGASAPGMVVIQEWWGLNDQIKGVADKLAENGFRALVPDLYRGKVTDTIVFRQTCQYTLRGLTRQRGR